MYRTWIFRDYGFYTVAQDIISSVISGRFQSYKLKSEGLNESPYVDDRLDHYLVIFKPTNKLYHLINWGAQAEPTYDIMMYATDVALYDIVLPARDIIFKALCPYAPKFTNEQDTSRYNHLVSQFLISQIFITSDVINRKFYLIIKK